MLKQQQHLTVCIQIQALLKVLGDNMKAPMSTLTNSPSSLSPPPLSLLHNLNFSQSTNQSPLAIMP